MNEDTLIKTVRLPKGYPPFAWYGDANVLGISEDVRTEEERERVISEAVAHWRRNFIRVVADNSLAEEPCDEGPHLTVEIPDRIFPAIRRP